MSEESRERREERHLAAQGSNNVRAPPTAPFPTCDGSTGAWVGAAQLEALLPETSCLGSRVQV